VTTAWEQATTDEAVAGLVEEVCDRETELLPRIEKALRLVQDEFRYLSVNLEHGGQIPTPPDLVARRRFGDCKDLSVLLVKILRRLGVSAHAVLVNTAQRRSIAELLHRRA
jgi:transglutaminase-like putative cysteine protease